jgi:hypothetical protein
MASSFGTVEEWCTHPSEWLYGVVVGSVGSRIASANIVNEKFKISLVEAT